MNKIELNLKLKETYENLNRGNTVILYLFAVETGFKMNHCYHTVHINLNEFNLGECLQSEYGLNFAEAFNKRVIMGIIDSLQKFYEERIEGIGYHCICYNKPLSKEEVLKEAERYWNSFMLKQNLNLRDDNVN